MKFSYSYSEVIKDTFIVVTDRTSDPNDVKAFLDKLTRPKRDVSVSFGLYPRRKVWVDVNFYSFKRVGIEMEIMPYDQDKNFAHVDIRITKQIVDVMFKLSEVRLLRKKLQKLPIKWIC